MADVLDNSGADSWSEELLLIAEDRARATLRDTGFELYIDDLGSDAAWIAINAAVAASKGPMGRGARAGRARQCLLFTALIRDAREDGDVDALIRYSVALGALDGDLLGHASTGVMAPIHRAKGLRHAQAQRRQRQVENLREWHLEAARFRAEEPGASRLAVAKHVAGFCGAKVETVRKALRRRDPEPTGDRRKI